MKKNEQKIYGWNACVSFSKAFPDQIIRAYCTETSRGKVGYLLKQLAAQKKAYHIVTASELTVIADSEHHEGLCLLVARPESHSEDDLLRDTQKWSQANQLILCFDQISNPNNLGAIVRTAAHFGVSALFLCNTPEATLRSLLSGSYHRTAEGGAVHVKIYASEQGATTLQELKKAGWTIYSTSSHGKTSALHQCRFPAKTILILGSESSGVSKEFAQLANEGLGIQGSGLVESLNVANASAIFLAEHFRQRHAQRTLLPERRFKPTRVAGGVGKKRRGS